MRKLKKDAIEKNRSNKGLKEAPKKYKNKNEKKEKSKPKIKKVSSPKGRKKKEEGTIKHQVVREEIDNFDDEIWGAVRHILNRNPNYKILASGHGRFVLAKTVTLSIRNIINKDGMQPH